MMRRDRHWQEAAVGEVSKILQPDADVVALIQGGSSLKPETLDLWSDLDLLLVVKDHAVSRYYPSLDWIRPLGRPYAYSQSSTEFKLTTRIWFEDLRHVDVVVTTESGLAQVEAWPLNPFWEGTRIVFSRSPRIGEILGKTFARPVPPLPSPEQFAAMVNGFWFKGMLAVQKVGRNDLLIALHLALDLVRDCCVLGMALRDRLTSASQHREGGVGNQMVAGMVGTQRPYTPSGILDMIEQVALEFERLAKQWAPSYQEQRQPLLNWIKLARPASQTGPAE